MEEGSVTCPGCGAEARTRQKFCQQCGEPLSTICSQCATPLDANALFCGECGTPVEDVDRPQPIPERRLVSTMFCDLVGFTPLSEHRDPEKVRELLTDYFDLARSVIEGYGGAVDKFIGDAVMGVWGSPVAHEDDAERAVRAALDLVSEVTVLGTRTDIAELAARAGVATGETAVLLDSPGQGMVAGDLVNTASRLQAVAEPGTVLVDQATLGATRGAIAFGTVRELELKGKSGATSAWLAIQVIAKRGGEGRARGIEGPFVGRVSELQLLKDLYRSTAREGRAHLVSVTGIAGIGKSRLVWELEKYLDGLVETVYWHHGRSPSYGEGITFWALGEMVRHRARIAETDDRETTSAKLAETLVEYVDEADRGWIGPHLEALLGLADSPDGERDELFAAWRRFFEHLSRRGPVVMVFEDLQWADHGLLDFVESLVEWSRSYPILILALARPELTDRRPTWGIGQRRFTSLHLEPLQDEEMNELIDGLVPGVPSDLAERIRERAAGVPLYAVETVRMLIDRGSLVPADGGYVVASEVPELAISESLHALLAARLDDLDIEDRMMMQRASVLGQTFITDALAVLEDQEPEKLQRRLTELVRRELLVLDADPRSPERGQYGFVQSMLREVAYGTLSRGERRDLHLRVAAYLEGLEDDELAGAVAHHYVRARQADPDDRQLGDQIRAALRTAAERASSLGSHDQELAFLEQAMEVTEDPRELAGHWEDAARACVQGGAFERAEPLLRRALEWYRSEGDASAVARVTARLGGVLLMSSRVEEALDMLEAALAVTGTPDEPDAERAMLQAELARAYAFHEDPLASLNHVDAALTEAAQLDVVPVIVEGLVTRGMALSQLGRSREAAAVTEGALSLAVRHALWSAEFRARNNLAVFAGWADPVRTLDELTRPGLAAARKVGDADSAAALGHKAVRDALDIGEWEWARSVIDEVLLPGLSFFSRLHLQLWLVKIDAWQGRIENARRLLEEFRPLVDKSTSPQDHFFFYAREAELALAAGHFGEARQTYLTARASFGELTTTLFDTIAASGCASAALAERDPESLDEAIGQMAAIREQSDRLRALTAGYRGGLALLREDVDTALPLLEEATATFRSLGLTVDLALLQTEVALLLDDAHPTGKAAADEARQIWERLGAEPFLARLT